jgi:hypothetical protein
MGTLTILTLGFLLGIRHAVDPDHVVAVGTMATRTASLRSSAMVGALWGLGHTVTLLGVGGVIVVWRSALAPRMALAMEFGVALMLITLGVMNLLMARGADPRPPTAARPVAVGMVHGMAGSAAIAILVLTTIQSSMVGVLYLLLFGMGTITGMVIVTAAVVIPATRVMAQIGVPRRWMILTAGVVSIAFGLGMVAMLGGPEALLAAGHGPGQR